MQTDKPGFMSQVVYIDVNSHKHKAFVVKLYPDTWHVDLAIPTELGTIELKNVEYQGEGFLKWPERWAWH